MTSPWEALCLVEELVQLDVVKVTKRLLSRDSDSVARWRELSCELLAVHRLDWRRVLCSTLQLVHFPVQLAGRMKEPVGTLAIRADLLNCKRTASISHEARAFLNKEALQRNTSNHSFYKYAKQWWEEYRSETREAKQLPPHRSNGTESPGERKTNTPNCWHRSDLAKDLSRCSLKTRKDAIAWCANFLCPCVCPLQ